MVIPLIIRGVRMAAKGAKNFGSSAKNVAKQGWQGAQNVGGAVQQGWQKVPGSAKVGAVTGAAGGLMGGLALAGIRGGHRAASKLGEKEIGKKPALILILPILLAIFDYFSGKNGIPLVSFFSGGGGGITETILEIATSFSYVAAVIIYWIMKKPQSKGEWIFPVFLFMLGFLILVFGTGSQWVFIHSVFAMVTFVYLLDGFNANTSRIHWVFLILLFMDIFGLATFDKLFPEIVLNTKSEGTFISGTFSTDIFFNRLLVPYWFFFYLFQIKPGRARDFIWIGLTLFYTGIGLSSIIVPSQIPFEDLSVQKEAAENALVKFVDNWRDQIASWLTGRIQYAVTGKVEKNQYEPLGVYLQNVQSADPRYYEDEDVIIWGTVTARTLDDPINIKVGCFVQPDIDKVYANKTDPDKKFSVFTLEEQDFACTFTKEYNKKNEILESGSSTIKAFADFNFETLSFLKVYFMNRERQRAMVREGLDPFEEFAITDRNPVAVYTNGPAKIEMGTNNPLISVSEDYIVEPSLDIKIDNREGWQGEIKKLKEFVLFLPEGVEMDPWLSCNKKFSGYDNNMCKTQSCIKFVKNECLEVCDGFINYNENYDSCVGACGAPGVTDPKCIKECGYPTTTCESKCKDAFGEDCINCKRALEINGYNSCADTCNENFDTCQTTCDSFFVEGGQEYKGYALDVNDIKYRDEEKDFEKGKLFRCRFRPTENVLGASPFTTKSFRVKARYNYSLEKDVRVEIAKVPKEEKMHVGPPRDLRGHVENIKEEDGKIVGDIVTEWKRSVNDGSGANDVIGYRVYRKQKLEDGWDKVADFNSGTNTFDEGGDKWYRHTDHVEFPADFKYYYHAEAVDDEGNWEKSLQMLEILPGPASEEPKVSSLERPKEEGELA